MRKIRLCHNELQVLTLSTQPFAPVSIQIASCQSAQTGSVEVLISKFILFGIFLCAVLLPRLQFLEALLLTLNSKPAIRVAHSFGGSSAPPTCKWLKSRKVALSWSLIPCVKFGSLSRRFRADSGMSRKIRSFCCIV